MQLKTMLLEAPDDQLDHNLFYLVEKWEGEDPTALQLLELLDHCVYGAGASEFVMGLLNTFLKIAMEREGVSYDRLTSQAVWRDTLDG